MSSSHKNLSDFSHIKIKSAQNLKFAIVVSQWNAEITGALLNGAIDGLINKGEEAAITAIQMAHISNDF